MLVFFVSLEPPWVKAVPSTGNWTIFFGKTSIMFLCFKKFPKIDVKKSEGKPLFKNISKINVKKSGKHTF